MSILTINEAEKYLSWAEQQNPGPWVEHSKVVARSAAKIAENVAGMNPDKAYAFGLSHDIGRYKGVTSLRHIYDGYVLMSLDGYDEAAQICLTHSYPVQDFAVYVGGDNDCSREETAKIIDMLQSYQYTEYDRLIQLCDSISLPIGVCLLEKRLLDVAMRYGIKPCSQVFWKQLFLLMEEFRSKIGHPVYDLFPEAPGVTFG